MAPDSRPHPCVDGQQDKTCKQLPGGNTCNHRQQTMTHTAINLPEPLWCPCTPEGHCGYARGSLRVMVMQCVCIYVCVCVCVCLKREHNRAAVTTENLSWGASGGGSVTREGRNYLYEGWGSNGWVLYQWVIPLQVRESEPSTELKLLK